MNWRGRPLTSHEVVVNSIAATRTRTACTSDSRSRSAPSSTASAKPWPSSVTKAAAVRIRPRLPVTSPRARVSAGRPRNFSPASRARGANVSVAARVTSWPAWRSTAPSPVYGATSPRDPAAAITILIGFPRDRCGHRSGGRRWRAPPCADRRPGRGVAATAVRPGRRHAGRPRSRPRYAGACRAGRR